MQYDVDMQEMRAYILDKFRKEGDFDFLKEGELEAMVDALLQEDQAYLASLPEDGEYDDDAAYEACTPTCRPSSRRIRCTPCA